MGRIVEITSDGLSLRIERGFLMVFRGSQSEPLLSRIPLDEIESLIINSYGASITSHVLFTLGERCIPVVFCDSRHMPVTLALPVIGNYEHSKRLRQQIQLTFSQSAELWRTIVETKVSRQADLLDVVGKSSAPLRRMVTKVINGDTSNIEAQAAKVYWPALFGRGYRRSSEIPLNAKLNYGYAILRSAVARSICATGLSISLGIHHSNASNPMCLVDDLMEPFRPLVDKKVYDFRDFGEELTVMNKQELASLLTESVLFDNKMISVEALIKEFVYSFYQVCVGGKSKLLVNWSFC